ncbi:hypothetical protein [Devosia sp.]|uniref:hypothetical protein n=1 Tax=Devosia sp. TaxID=1871048 RepID=UPI003BA94049
MRISIASALVGMACLISSSGLGAESDYYPQATWDKTYGGELNISVFIYRDLNANGTYDIGDRPLAGVAVQMTGAGKTQLSRSNINGFANFRMSATQQDMEVTSVGTYQFEVMPPPGTVISSGNAVQQSAFELLTGAPADMFATTPPIPVGITSALTVSGFLASPGTGPIEAGVNGLADTEIKVTAPDGTVGQAFTDKTGQFSFHASPGEWILGFDDGSGPIERRVTVADAPVYLGVLTNAPVPVAAPSVATFEGMDFIAVDKVPSGYAGVQWRNFVAVQQEYYGGEGYINTTTSGDFVAYGGSGHPAFIANDLPFTFEGGYFGVGWTSAEGETLNIRAYRSDQLAYIDHIHLSALTPIYYAPNISGVTRVEFSTAHYWQFVCDDLRVVTAP